MRKTSLSAARNPLSQSRWCTILILLLVVIVAAKNLLDRSNSASIITPLLTTTTSATASRSIAPSFGTTAKACPAVDVTAPSAKQHLKSQSGEDVVLLKWFNGLCEGTYFEMGALDGVLFSNTYFFNRMLQWKGLLVELSPRNYAKLKVNRPEELAVVNAAVCDDQQLLHFYDGPTADSPVYGIWEFSAESFRERWWPGVTLQDTTEVTCRPLHEIMATDLMNGATTQQQLYYFDFMSLDCEGCELTAVQSIDWTNTAFGVILVESDRHNERKNLALRMFLQSLGYVYKDTVERSDWFVHPQFHLIYGHLLYPPKL